MPPKTDTRLEAKILKAGERLWVSRGERGLTLRAVARAAGTTTPSVYKRFRSKRDLQVALAERFKAEVNAYCLEARTLEEVYQRFVDFAEKNPHKYELLWRTWTEIFHPKGPRPVRTWFLAQLANHLGGAPEDYSHFFYALLLMSHGAATMLTVPGDPEAHEEVRRNFPKICNVLFRNVSIFRK